MNDMTKIINDLIAGCKSDKDCDSCPIESKCQKIFSEPPCDWDVIEDGEDFDGEDN